MLLARSNFTPNVPDWIATRFDAVPDWVVFLFQYKTFAILFLASALSVAAVTPIYILVAERLGWVDRPAGRKRHTRTTATMGGLVVFAPVFVGAAVALSLENRIGEMLREHRTAIHTLLACTACMIGLGIIDDRRGVRPRVKLLVQCVVALAAVWLGYRINAFTLPWLHSVPLPAWAGVVVAVVWIVGITNAINLTDGLDGLAAGVCLLASSVNAIAAVWLGNYYMAVLMLLLAGSLLGFLRWNFHPARCFLGDTGALALGMFLALSSLRAAQKAHTVVLILVPLFALGYPIFDTLLTVARRTLRGQPLFSSDRDHIHHRLLERGSSHSWVAIQIYAFSLILCVVCLAAVTANHLALGLSIAAVLLIALFSVRFLGYLEWGGWITQWRARDDTRRLHLAAALARLRIQQAPDPEGLLAAIGVFAEEIGCHEIDWARADNEVRWRASTGPAASDHSDSTSFEYGVSESSVVRFRIAGPQPITAVQQHLLEDLCQSLAQRAAGDDDDS